MWTPPVIDFPERIAPRSKTMWATFAPTRKPEFKAHETLGRAKNAMHYRISDSYGGTTACALYEFTDGDWVRRLAFQYGEDQERAHALVKEMKA